MLSIFKGTPPPKQEERFKFPKACLVLAVGTLFESASYYINIGNISAYYKDVLQLPIETGELVTWLYITSSHGFSVIMGFIADGHTGTYPLCVSIIVAAIVGAILTMVFTYLKRRYLFLLGVFLYSIVRTAIWPLEVVYVGNQFPMPQQSRMFRKYIQTKYMFSYTGALLGITISTLVQPDKPCLGLDSCYLPMFAINLLASVVMLILYLSARRYMPFKKPRENTSLLCAKCIWYAIKHRKTLSDDEEDEEHWLDIAKDVYGEKLVSDLKRLMNVFGYFLPGCVFFLLYLQQSQSWINIARTTNTRLLGFYISPVQVQIFRSGIASVMLPVFVFIIYPWAESRNFFSKDIQRMTWGMFLLLMAFVAATITSVAVDYSLVRRNLKSGYFSVTFFNPTMCEVGVTAQKILYEANTIPIMGVVFFEQLDWFPDESFELVLNSSCGYELTKEFFPKDQQRIGIYIHNNEISEFQNSVVQNITSRHAIVLLLADVNDHKSHVLTLHNADYSYNYKITYSDTNSKKELSVYPDTYYLPDQHMLFQEQSVELILVSVDSESTETINVMELYHEHLVRVSVLLPQYFFLACSDILFLVTSSEFIYTQSPYKIKCIVGTIVPCMSLTGSLLLRLFSFLLQDYTTSTTIGIYALIMLIASLIFAVLGFRFRYHIYESIRR